MRISRRMFVEGLVALGALYAVAPITAFPVSAAARESRQRPPGALPEHEFNLRCIRCLKCGQACHTGAITFGNWLTGAASDTPFVDPNSCNLCMECIDVCPTGALQETLVDPSLYPAFAERTFYLISSQQCVLFVRRRKWCLDCYEACPRKGRAIKLDLNGRPLMDERYCTGCGICERVCPYTAIFPKGG